MSYAASGGGSRKREKPVQRSDTPTLIAETLEVYLSDVQAAIAGLPLEALSRTAQELLEARRREATVYIVGNGGGAATASHMASDLAKTASVDGMPGVRTLALADNTPLLTAWANDACYEEAFAAPLRHLVRPGDVLIALSASGNSVNVLRAVEAAGGAGATTIGLLGFGGGRLRERVDICVLVPADAYGPTEDAQLVINHALTAALRRAIEAELADTNRTSSQEPIRRPLSPRAA